MTDDRLSEVLNCINHGDKKGVKSERFLFDEHADIRLNDLVKTVRESGYKANRSSIMRHLMNELLQKLGSSEEVLPKAREIHHSSFYFEKGTRELLETYVPFRDRNATIEHYILESYVPTSNRELLFDKPDEVETWRIGMARAAFDKLDGLVNEVHTKGISRSSLMRDAVMQLISQSANTDARKLITEIRLQKALHEFENTFGSALRAPGRV
ncbi:hypothetical protein I6J18_00145 (plasmid) [Peribacillus psychrosaccharolyticus]|uniref:Uncharacterized protein n=1 Tax=Peribacillus psychrosaccharolyticus TaxID=1407 RepID=A0A974NIP5_PERPY|nr:hypothetical protein [Peribacillus psychrosaccharolyticus]MED3746595.1 hypothetical protein [Peribacillus psychrosaccharolyticus]QQS98453.1 hypothetical protein I6J18_00145 [Peribacillus psychrosaccharolyticus]